MIHYNALNSVLSKKKKVIVEIVFIVIVYFQTKEELNSTAISQHSYEQMIDIYNQKLNAEMNKSVSLEKDKNHWENEYKLLYKKHESVSILQLNP